MSFSIYWEPVKPVKGHELPRGLKYVIARRLWDADGTIRNQAFLNKAYVSYLQGVRDATTFAEVREGAEALISAITEHGEVRVWIGDEDD